MLIFFLFFLSQETGESSQLNPPPPNHHSCSRQTGRQGTLVTARQANHWDLPFPLVRLLSRSLHSYTQTTAAHINTHHWSPPRRSISQDHTVSSGSQALLTRSADVDGSFTQPDSWPAVITGVRGPATPHCSGGGGVPLSQDRRDTDGRLILFSLSLSLSFFFSRPNVKR